MTFSTPEEADVALTFLDKALFTYPAPKIASSEGETQSVGGQRTRQLRVARWDGRERFDVGGESAEAEAERLERWNQFLGDDPDSISDENDSEAAMQEVEPEHIEATDTDEELEARSGGVESGAETE